jgi:hypothetical protein
MKFLKLDGYRPSKNLRSSVFRELVISPQTVCGELMELGCTISCLHDHTATASVQELRPSALRSELAFRALRVLDSSPLAGSGSPLQELLLLATRLRRDLGAAHLCAPSGCLSRVTGQKEKQHADSTDHHPLRHRQQPRNQPHFQERSDDEIVLAALEGTADEKLTGLALRLVLSDHVGIPHESQPDLLTEAEDVFAPKRPKVFKNKSGGSNKPKPTAAKVTAKKAGAPGHPRG